MLSVGPLVAMCRWDVAIGDVKSSKVVLSRFLSRCGSGCGGAYHRTRKDLVQQDLDGDVDEADDDRNHVNPEIDSVQARLLVP